LISGSAIRTRRGKSFTYFKIDESTGLILGMGYDEIGYFQVSGNLREHGIFKEIYLDANS
jgi:hypothetical protein